MKRAINSISDFREYINDNLKSKSGIPRVYGRYVADSVSSISLLMKTCRGRGKICSMLQYLAALYYSCNKHSELLLVRQRFTEGLSVSAEIALKTKESMRSARKVFKFLKFIEMISSIFNLMDSKKPFYMVLIKFCGLVVAVVNNIIDNLLWGINIGVLSSVIDQPTYKRWKATKYSTDLLRLLFKLLYYNFGFQMRNQEMKEILLKLKPHSKQIIEEDSPNLDLCVKYLEHRREIRFQILQSIIMLLRVTMLVRKLKLPGYRYVTSIYHAFCGLLSSLLAMIKLLLQKPTLMKIKNRDEMPSTGLNSKSSRIFDSVPQNTQTVRRIQFSKSGLKFQGIQEQDQENQRKLSKHYQ